MKQYCYARTSIEKDGTIEFDCFDLGDTFNPNNVTQTHSIFIKL